MGPEDPKVVERMKNVRHKILVLSGKGGVGKSTVAVNLAVALAAAGKQVGVLDIDFHGPSVPKMLGVDGMPLHVVDENTIHPFGIGDNFRVMSIGFLLRDQDDAVIWRGPMKYGVIKQFLGDVEWGDLDFLIVDSPPGTGDEPLSIAQLIPEADGAVIVTTPQDVALIDVRKSINFCRQLNLPVLGVVENMSGFKCPHCGEVTDIFKRGGGEQMAGDMNVPFLGAVPIDPGIVSASDDGKPYVTTFPETETGALFAKIAAPILGLPERAAPAATQPAAPGGCSGDCAGCSGGDAPGETPAADEAAPAGEAFKIAVPVAQGKLCMHFGHCEQFAVVTVDREAKQVQGVEYLTPPPHEPGVLPAWLNEQGVHFVIAGGMGSRAQGLFREQGVELITGAPAGTPEEIATAWMTGELEVGDNVCDH